MTVINPTLNEESLPRSFGAYVLIDKLGSGGLATVYRVNRLTDREHKQDLVLKCLKPELLTDKPALKLFKNEGEILQVLQHPNLPRVYEVGMLEAQPYIVMEYIAGYDLALFLQKLKRRKTPLPVNLAIYITMQILQALDYLHYARSPRGKKLNLIHSDVEPSNIYLGTSGQVKLGDFNVATLGAKHDNHILYGKAAYIAPEFFNGAALSIQLDLWGAAVCLYEMLLSNLVLKDLDLTQQALHDEAGNLIYASELSAIIPLSLQEILPKILHLNPRKRPETAASFYHLLKTYLIAHDPPENKGAHQVSLAYLVQLITNEPPAENLEPQIPLPPITCTQRYQVHLQKRYRRKWLFWLSSLSLGLLLAHIFTYPTFYLPLLRQTRLFLEQIWNRYFIP